MMPYQNIASENSNNLFNSLIIEDIKGKDEDLKFELLNNNLKLEQKL